MANICTIINEAVKSEFVWRARWTLHLTPLWRNNWRRNRSQIAGDQSKWIPIAGPPHWISFALCSAHAGAEIYSSSPSSTTSSSSSFSSTASPPDSSCLFVPNSVIIKQSFIVRVCVVINDCFYAKEIRITESESEIRNRIRNSGCSFRTMTDTRGQWKRMTEWHTSRIWKAKSISMLIVNRRRGKGRKGQLWMKRFAAAASIKSAAC